MTYAPHALTDDLETLPRMPAWVTFTRAETLEDVAFLSGAALNHVQLVLGHEQAFRDIQLHTRAVTDRADSFSGGNQQKMVLAKWLLTDAHTLLLLDPTRGVDVGTKHEIYTLIRDFARRGGAVLMFSSEIPEIVNVCDRALVVYDHRIAGDVAAEDLTEETIMHLALGGHPALGSAA